MCDLFSFIILQNAVFTFTAFCSIIIAKGGIDMGFLGFSVLYSIVINLAAWAL